MKNQMKKLTALLCAAAALISLSACGNNNEAETTEDTTQSISDAASQDEITTQGDITAVLTQSDETTEAQTESLTDGKTENTSAAKDSAAKASDKEKTTAKKSEAAKTTDSSDKSYTKAEVIAMANKALNDAKAKKAGFTKKYVRDAKGDIEGLPGWIKSLIRKNSTSTVKKGEDNTDEFPAAGFSWSSKLREQDVTSYSFKKEGNYYNIKLYLGKERNPGLGESSSYGRCMSVETVDSVESIPGISDVGMDYHDGHLFVKIDAATGRVYSCEFSAAADVSADVVVLGKLKVNDIVSTESFTNFVW